MRYLKNHRPHNENYCIYVCLMKFLSSFLAELTMIYIVCNSGDIKALIQDFFQVEFLIQIDSLFCRTHYSAEEISTTIEKEIIINAEVELHIERGF